MPPQVTCMYSRRRTFDVEAEKAGVRYAYAICGLPYFAKGEVQRLLSDNCSSRARANGGRARGNPVRAMHLLGRRQRGPLVTRVLVCGGRDYIDRERLYAELDRLHRERGFALLIAGGSLAPIPWPPSGRKPAGCPAMSIAATGRQGGRRTRSGMSACWLRASQSWPWAFQAAEARRT
jgi:YspA, cpYpsA-related SLOG family